MSSYESEELFFLDDEKSLNLAIEDIANEVDAFYAEVEALEETWRQFLREEDASHLQLQEFYWSALTTDASENDRIPSPLLGQVLASFEEEDNALNNFEELPFRLGDEQIEQGTQEIKLAGDLSEVQETSSTHEKASSQYEIGFKDLKDELLSSRNDKDLAPDDPFSWSSLELEKLFSEISNSIPEAISQNASSLNEDTPEDPESSTTISVEAGLHEASGVSTFTSDDSYTDFRIEESFSRNSCVTEVEGSHHTTSSSGNGTHEASGVSTFTSDDSYTDFRIEESFSRNSCVTEVEDSHHTTSSSGNGAHEASGVSTFTSDDSYTDFGIEESFSRNSCVTDVVDSHHTTSSSGNGAHEASGVSISTSVDSYTDFGIEESFSKNSCVTDVEDSHHTTSSSGNGTHEASGVSISTSVDSYTDFGIEESFSRNRSVTEVEDSHHSTSSSGYGTQRVNSEDAVIVNESVLQKPVWVEDIRVGSHELCLNHDQFLQNSSGTVLADNDTSGSDSTTHNMSTREASAMLDINSREPLLVEDTRLGSSCLSDLMLEESSSEFGIQELFSRNCCGTESPDSHYVSSGRENPIQPMNSDDFYDMPDTDSQVVVCAENVPCGSPGLRDSIVEGSHTPFLDMKIQEQFSSYHSGTELVESHHVTSETGNATQPTNSRDAVGIPDVEAQVPMCVENILSRPPGLGDSSSVGPLNFSPDLESQDAISSSCTHTKLVNFENYSFSDLSFLQVDSEDPRDCEASAQEVMLGKTLYQVCTVSASATSSSFESSSLPLSVSIKNVQVPTDRGVERMTLYGCPATGLQELLSSEPVPKSSSSFSNGLTSSASFEDCHGTQRLPLSDPSIARQNGKSPSDAELESISATVPEADQQNGNHQQIETVDQDMAVSVMAMLSKQLGEMSSKLLTLQTWLNGQNQAYEHVLNSNKSLRIAAQTLNSQCLNFKNYKLRFIDPQENVRMQESFGKNLIVKGIPEMANENLFEIVELLFIRVGCPLRHFGASEPDQNFYLVDAKRANVTGCSIRPIIVVFTNSLVRNRLLETSKRTEMFSDELCEWIRVRHPIKIEEQLTPLNLHILRECERLGLEEGGDVDIGLKNGVICLERLHFDADVIELNSLAALDKLMGEQQSDIWVKSSHSRNYFSSVD